MKTDTRPPALRSLGETLTALLGSADEPTWPRARIAVTDLGVDPGVARAWLPRGLRPSTPSRATLFVAEYPASSFGVPYREAALLLHARRRGRDVLHCPWIVVDDDTALVLGRELLGFPKKLARIDLEADDAHVSARVERRGTVLVSIDARPTRVDDTSALFAAPIVNVWGSPGLPGLLVRMAPPQITHAAQRLDGTVQLAGSEYDPIDELVRGRHDLDGRFVVADIGVPPDDAAPRITRLVGNAFRPVGVVGPRWLLERYLLRTR